MVENTLFEHLKNNTLTFTKLDIEKLPIENGYYKTDIYVGTAEISEDPSLYYAGIFDDNKNDSVKFIDDYFIVFKCNEESGYEILINKTTVSSSYNSIANKYEVQVNQTGGLYIELLKNESRYKTIFLKRVEEVNDVNSIKYAKFEVYLNLNMELADYEYYMVFSLNINTFNGSDYYYNYNTDNNLENTLTNICENYIKYNKLLLIYMNDYNQYINSNIPIFFYFPIMNGYYVEDPGYSPSDFEFRNISLLNNPSGEDYIKDASFTDYLVYPNHTYKIPENATISLKIIEYNINPDNALHNTRVSTWGEPLAFKPDRTVIVDLTSL